MWDTKAVDSNFSSVLYFARIFAVPQDLRTFFRMPSGWTLTEVWERHINILRSIPKGILLDHSLADDVLQDAFASILSSKRKFESEAEAYNYARRAVINTTISYYRRIRKEYKDYQHLQMKGGDGRDCRTPLTTILDWEEKRAQLSLAAEIRTVVDQLKPDQREALNLIFGKHQKVKDTCRETGIPYSTLRSRALSAVDRIRRQLQEKGVLSGAKEVKK